MQISGYSDLQSLFAQFSASQDTTNTVTSDQQQGKRAGRAGGPPPPPPATDEEDDDYYDTFTTDYWNDVENSAAKNADNKASLEAFFQLLNSRIH